MTRSHNNSNVYLIRLVSTNPLWPIHEQEQVARAYEKRVATYDDQPVDYVRGPRIAHPMRGEDIARAVGDEGAAWIDLYASLRKPTVGERLVTFFRRHAHRIGIGCYVIGVVTAMYFAFRLGAGALS